MIDPQAPPDEPAPGGSTRERVSDTASEPSESDAVPDPGAERSPLDLERVSADLDGVEAALGRLDDGTYWTDELTGEPIPDEVLASNPVARRAEAAE